MEHLDVYSYIQANEANFKLPIDLLGWNWNMPEHIKTAFYYKHSRLLTGNNDMKPVKNIVRPILNLQYRAEDLDVKEIFLYVDDPDKFHLSFFVKKYHDEVFLKEQDLDTFLDRTNENRIDYGGCLVKDSYRGVPEVVYWDSLAFCDQTDILSGPIAIKHYYSPDQLMAMEDKGWGEEKNGATISLEDLIVLSRPEKQDHTGKASKTPGRYIEVYEVHGNMPERYLGKDSERYTSQLQIVAFYAKQGGGQEGVTLFRGKEKESPFKFICRDYIHGRALGFGAVEELAEAQVWTNYTQLRYRELLDTAATTLHQTTDDVFAKQGRLYNVGKLKVALMSEGATLSQVDTFPRNINLFNQYAQEWEAHAQKMGAANDSIMGVSPASGTPFALQELVTQESRGLHEFRRKKFAKDIEKIYRDWILPYIKKELEKGQRFLSILSVDEMQYLADIVINNQINKLYAEGNIGTEEVEEKKQELKAEFMKDNRKFIEIVKEDMKDLHLSISINIAGKQKNMSSFTDKLVNIFRQIIASANPQTGQTVIDTNPKMAKLFNRILETSGLEPMDFMEYSAPMQQFSTQPLQELTNNKENYATGQTNI